MTEQEFLKRYAQRLNDQQREAVVATDGPLLLLAVPGSGKTTVLVTRLGYMILVKGIDPASILTLTYTVAAAKDMKRRFAGIFPRNWRSSWNFVPSTECAIRSLPGTVEGSGRNPISCRRMSPWWHPFSGTPTRRWPEVLPRKLICRM
ncbi:MAG: UvrD-helicase domain-containing protein [Lachnospiraceae bacterium]|nr:UvrD-helicase domain-containing protein [Lachnospiraceae bacterium]